MFSLEIYLISKKSPLLGLLLKHFYYLNFKLIKYGIEVPKTINAFLVTKFDASI
jgi:hypothetical protein